MKRKYQKNKSITLLEAFDRDNEQFSVRVGKDRSCHSYNIMVRAREFVADFLVLWEHRKDIPLSSIEPDFIHRFSTYLSVERGLRHGTIWLNCMMLKGVVQRAHKRGLILTNPFAEFHIAKNIRERQYLSEEELHQLMIRHFDNPLQNYTRDIFVFAALTGMSFVDIRALRKSDIYEIDGYQWIITSRHKTGIPFKVRLLPQALTILERYNDPLKEQIFDRLGYHAIAKRLRQVMKESGITRPVTFHCARHTFAIMALNQGMPIESVSRILGHSNITATQIYARITMKKLTNDFQHLELRLSSIFSKNVGYRTYHFVKKRILSILHLLAKMYRFC